MVFLHNLTMADIMLRILAALLFAALAGGLTALLLRAMGDRQGGWDGRLTANPFAHVTLSGIFLAIAFRTSWIAPVPLERAGGRRLVPVLAVLGAMALMLALIPGLDLLRISLHAALPRTMGTFVLAEIDTLQLVILQSVVLGLLPLPGMWLGGMLPALLPGLEKRWRKGAGIGLSLAAILLILGWFPDLRPVLEMLRRV